MRSPGKSMATASLLAAAAVWADAGPDPAIFDAGMENQAGLAFSPDGATAWWVEWNGDWGGGASSRRTIYSARRSADGWSVPTAAPFSGSFDDDDPFVSPDGRWLYFVSDRPDTADAADDAQTDADIWRYRLEPPHDLERLAINSAAAEYSPVVTASGALYFASARDGGPGRGDLYRAAPSAGGFLPAEVLGPAVNTPSGEWNLWVDADESEILFEASSRPSNVSVPGDLYFSRRTATGWTVAVPVQPLNSADSDLLPRLHPGGETLYYTTAPIGGHARIVATNWPILRESLTPAAIL